MPLVHWWVQISVEHAVSERQINWVDCKCCLPFGPIVPANNKNSSGNNAFNVFLREPDSLRIFRNVRCNFAKIQNIKQLQTIKCVTQGNIER